MAHSPRSRQIALALPNVCTTRPRRTSSRLASSTSARNVSSTDPSSCLSRDAAKLRQRLAAAEREIQLVELPVQVLATLHRLDYLEWRAQPLLRFFDATESAGGQKCKNRRPQAGHLAFGHQDRFAHHIGVDLVEHRVLLRDAATVDDAPHWHAVLLHALQDHARMKGRSLDCG